MRRRYDCTKDGDAYSLEHDYCLVASVKSSAGRGPFSALRCATKPYRRFTDYSGLEAAVRSDEKTCAEQKPCGLDLICKNLNAQTVRFVTARGLSLIWLLCLRKQMALHSPVKSTHGTVYSNSFDTAGRNTDDSDPISPGDPLTTLTTSRETVTKFEKPAHSHTQSPRGYI